MVRTASVSKCVTALLVVTVLSAGATAAASADGRGIAPLSSRNRLPKLPPSLRELHRVPRGGKKAESLQPLPPPADAREAAARAAAEQQLEEEESTGAAAATSTAASVPAAVVTAPAPAAPATADHTKSTKSKLTNLAERGPPAILMSLGVYLLLKFGGETGLVALVLLLQVGMYHESTSVIEDYHVETLGSASRPTAFDLVEKWWWFATVVVGTSLRNLVERSAHLTREALDLLCYGMGAVALLGAVAGMAAHAEAGPERFRDYLGTVAGCHFSLLFLVGQSSFWIKTVHEFGLEWVIYPALLVIVNDTMAYFFGLTMGRRKLLPRLSPKKTVEGFAGAALSTVAVSVPLLRAILGRGGREVASNAVQMALVMGAFTSIVSPFGGFLASAVKRAHGAKDFGTLIPGHGGVVDRFDCQVVTAPFVYLFLKYVDYGGV